MTSKDNCDYMLLEAAGKTPASNELHTYIRTRYDRALMKNTDSGTQWKKSKSKMLTGSIIGLWMPSFKLDYAKRWKRLTTVDQHGVVLQSEGCGS